MRPTSARPSSRAITLVVAQQMRAVTGTCAVPSKTPRTGEGRLVVAVAAGVGLSRNRRGRARRRGGCRALPWPPASAALPACCHWLVRCPGRSPARCPGRSPAVASVAWPFAGRWPGRCCPWSLAWPFACAFGCGAAAAAGGSAFGVWLGSRQPEPRRLLLILLRLPRGHLRLPPLPCARAAPLPAGGAGATCSCPALTPFPFPATGATARPGPVETSGMAVAALNEGPVGAGACGAGAVDCGRARVRPARRAGRRLERRGPGFGA